MCKLKNILIWSRQISSKYCICFNNDICNFISDLWNWIKFYYGSFNCFNRQLRLRYIIYDWKTYYNLVISMLLRVGLLFSAYNIIIKGPKTYLIMSTSGILGAFARLVFILSGIKTFFSDEIGLIFKRIKSTLNSSLYIIFFVWRWFSVKEV